MEIIDYLRIARRRLWVLILVPLLAGGAVAATVLLAPQTYTANAVVAAPALVGGSANNQYNGAQGVSQFAAAFQAAAVSPPVLDQVAARTHVAESDLVDGLTITQLGTSPQMEVTYVTTDRKVAGTVADITASETLNFLFTPQVALAQKQVEAATGDVAAANKAITDWTAQHGSIAPDKLYDSKLQQIDNLQQQQLTYSATGLATASAALATAIQNRQAELRKLAPLVGEYQQLLDKKSVAMGSLTAAEQALQAARSQSAAAAPENVVTVSAVHATDLTPALVQKVGAAVGAGLFLALGLVIVLELLFPRRVRVPEPVRATAVNAPSIEAHGAMELTGASK